MSRILVDQVRSNSASSDAITLANDGTCTANITNNLSNRNLMINGAMQVAQRGTSATVGDNSFATVDRFKVSQTGLDEDVTQAQVDVASGTTPYTLGFRKAFKITNGNQTSGAGVGDLICFSTKLEAQDIANSGWNYLSASSYITLSFWVKSSVAQNFYFRAQANDGTIYSYVMETGSLSADTWTKVTKTIPGNSNLQFDNDTGSGLMIRWAMFRGTTNTGTRPLNAWAAYDGSTRYPNYTSTWFTTNDATFEITGIQLEVGSTATDFEHRLFGQELALCQRYFYKTYDYATAPGTATFVGAQHGRNFDTGAARSAVPICLNFPVRMRAVPTLTWYAGDGQSGKYSTGSTVGGTNLTTEKSVGTGIDESETGIYHANFSEDVPATNLYAYHVLADAEL